MTNVERRLAEALQRAGDVAPSADLWSRVVHSIEEDQRHRRRAVGTLLGCAALLIALVAIGWFSMTDGTLGRVVPWQMMEVLETTALVATIVLLGPALRRFGRGYAGDLLVSSTGMADRLLVLLDVAYYLVFAGYVLLSVDLEPTFLERIDTTWTSQLHDASLRLGGLLLAMGVLHALTLVTMPLIALVTNATRAGRRLPWWVWVLVAVGTWQVLGLLFLLPILGGDG